MNITQILMDQIGEGGLSAMANKVGADKQQTAKAMEGILPTLLGAMSTNTQSSNGASGLLGALDRDHDGSILDDIGGFIGHSDQGPGDGILKHVLGDNRSSIENGLSNRTGMQSDQIGNLMKMAAPILMGYLGKQRRQTESNGFDLGGISSMLGGLAGEADRGTDLDLGDIMNTVGGLLGGSGSSGQKSGGIGGMLGKLFGG
ncbi:MAG: DUF937 domain-containing protein [Flavobacteriales bacterium]|nr:DUF937 domain-containing protein [Bacteroidota bacterium]MCB9240089.1 DUF937 domain-containing protein [Flavobacteriales bacterium]